ncbi:gamma-interferon-inducible lysosomal thiol reductase-like protein [Choristoneura fumiferana]|uniref:gamma-interferon-inducible lysosomal thiol reductase-like protein n=1 Tax=Choristoneura fumiferana TaxID=7141 RepID=UPI003D15531C
MISYHKFLLCLSSVIAIVTSDPVFEPRLLVERPTEYYTYQLVQDMQEKVKLEVFYECLCPYCIKFHTGPLIDVVAKIGSYLDIKSYPYGNAKTQVVDGKTEIVCQHGPAECYGNKLHACAIDIIQNETQAEFYNTCMMARNWGGAGSTDVDAANCGKSMGVDGAAVTACAQSQKGEDLLEYYGKETGKHPEKKSVPYVLINNKSFEDEYDQLMAQVCAAFQNPPPQCQEVNT